MVFEYSVKLHKQSKRPVLVQEKAINYGETSSIRFSSPEAIAYFMLKNYAVDEMADEYVYMLTLTTRLNLTGVFLVSKGDISCSITSCRDIAINALLAGAVNVILVHNHPSGDATPSDDDLTTTKKVATALSLVGVRLLDHVIIGDFVMSLAHEYPDSIKPYKIT